VAPLATIAAAMPMAMDVIRMELTSFVRPGDKTIRRRAGSALDCGQCVS